MALLCGGGQCLLLFDLPVCGEAQTSSSSSRVLQQEEDGEKLTVVLVIGWAVVLLRSLFLFSYVSALLLIFVSITLLLSFFLPLLHPRSLSLFLSFLSLLPLPVLCVSLLSSSLVLLTVSFFFCCVSALFLFLSLSMSSYFLPPLATVPPLAFIAQGKH